MGCNCWGKRQPKQHVAQVIVPKTQPRPAPAAPQAREIVLPSQPPQSNGVPKSKFCNRCGWMVKKVQYSDPRSGVSVEKFICPNRDCKNYSS